ncbi:MAG: ABC transporter ATP-binding protein [Candidatus Pseudobacter hemicellulosilyticus]|uniref:ABC transporter ATP-binding protein n=1 Tax=Candidatus Pseudobacter hemicellulosilyticus TaxID=3121375 RepID=A0AAJ6BJY9_9BACT|nr:MAG: ABC transporter ATP-binding protein [Pseudobacter sp.]
MSQPIVDVQQLSHRYQTAWAIRDINFSINQCGILGLLGSNGAGKSTTMNIMCGVLQQTAGRVLIDGIDLGKYPKEAKQQIGFLPQSPPLHTDLTVNEYLQHCAYLRRIPKKQVPAALEEAKERCGVAHFSHRLIRNLSGGYRQRVGIAQAIIHKPKLVVLDEPTNGLDPNQILEVRSLIRDIAKDRSVIFSTHILSEVEVLCDEIRMIEQGKLVFAGSMDNFRNYVKPRSVLVLMEAAPSEQALLAIPGVTQVKFLTARQLRIFFEEGADISEALIRASLDQQWQLKELTPDRISLDLIFAQLSNAANR